MRATPATAFPGPTSKTAARFDVGLPEDRRAMMEKQFYQAQPEANQTGIDWSRIRERLVYVPGAIVLAYGFWLSVTV